MKKTGLFILGCVLVAGGATAYGQNGRFYLKGDIGGNLTMDTDLKEFFGPVTPGSKVQFDPGVRLGLAAGYWLTDWFALEGEVGVMENNIKSITEAERVDATFGNVPFLVNAKFQLPNSSRFTPYIGGGIGGSAAVLDVDHIVLNGIGVHGTDSEAVFAYQGFAGVRFVLNEAMGLNLEYRYFGTTAPSWEGDFAGDNIRFGQIGTHAVSVAFEVRF